MGIYDRDYYRQQQPRLAIRAPQTVVVSVILVNVALWLANGLLTPPHPGTKELGAISYWLAAHGDTLGKPWMWWQFLTYGFVHDPRDFSHILFNMLGLWFLGRDVEFHYGRKEFLRLYLLLLVVGSVTWAAINAMRGGPPNPLSTVAGASGAVAGVVLLFALNFPRRTILFMFVLPMPAWVLGVLLVAGDILGATGKAGLADVAYSVHLAGAAFAFLYYHFGWSLSRLSVGGHLLARLLRPRPRLRLHDPAEEEEELAREVDRILEKISREGEASLSRKERRALENASREYQRRRQGPA